MSIDFDAGSVTKSNGGEEAYYQLTQNTTIPELQINVPFSFNVNDVNAGKSQCVTATASNPTIAPITRLDKGRLFCVQGSSGIVLVEIMSTVGGNSSTLHLRETYWPNSAG